MSKIGMPSPKNKIATLITAALLTLPALSHADDDRAAAELAKAMTMNLIQALVESGTLTQEKADRFIADAQSKADASMKAQAAVEFKSRYEKPAGAAANTPLPAGSVVIDAATLAGLTQALADARAAADAANAAAQKALAAAGAAAASAAVATTGAASSAIPTVALGGPVSQSAGADAATEKALAAAKAATAAAEKAVAAADATESNSLNASNSAAAAYAAYIASNANLANPVQPLPAPVVQALELGNGPDANAEGKRTVRVAYLPEATKAAMRDQIKQEVLLQAKNEKWGDPGALPGWLNRVSISGDVRFRNELVKLDHANTPAGVNYSDGVFTRAANILGSSFSGIESPFDTQHNFDFWSLRARLNIDAKVSDEVSTGFTVSTGNTSSRNSLSQNLGQNFSYYSVVLDKAFIKYEPAPWISLSAGRIGNPFFSTDILFAEDVYFEGMAITGRYQLTPTVAPYVVGGWFPLRMNNPGTSPPRNLGALQAGVDWAITPKTNFKFGAAIYDFLDIAGTAETQTAYQNGVSDYVSRYEYPANFRQMGNTLFIINAPTDPNINWGLASKFKEIDATASLDFASFEPFHVVLTSDYVKNTGYNTNDIQKRTTYKLLDGKDIGYQEKILVGMPVIRDRGNWNAALSYRYLGSDAVLDAFVNPDFGLGSTNTKGTIFTANYGIDKNTWITGRYLSSSLIDSMVPVHAGSTLPPTKLNVDMIQIELNARY